MVGVTWLTAPVMVGVVTLVMAVIDVIGHTVVAMVVDALSACVSACGVVGILSVVMAISDDA